LLLLGCICGCHRASRRTSEGMLAGIGKETSFFAAFDV
jgi:hypothetical protein